VLDSSSISLRLKNELKILPPKKIHEKGGPAVSEHLTLAGRGRGISECEIMAELRNSVSFV